MRITVDLPVETIERLDALAEKLHVTRESALFAILHEVFDETDAQEEEGGFALEGTASPGMGGGWGNAAEVVGTDRK